jgi:hypothetical protein
MLQIGAKTLPFAGRHARRQTVKTKKAPRLESRHGATNHCQVSGYGFSCMLSGSAQIPGGGLAGSSVGNKVKRDPLSLVEAAHPGVFDRADVHEDILATVIRLDESEALLAVEPLHGSFGHIALSFR